MKSNHPRIMLAAAASGSGKTTLAIGLLQALLTRGLKPAAFKCGPDYIDPMFHREVLGVHGGNLDLFFSSPEIVRGLFCAGAAGTDIAILEGAMGYYDGIGDTTGASGWEMASTTRTPTVLVLSPKGASLSVAALVEGFRHFREESMIRGIILNQCGESYHRRLAPMLERETGLPVYGALPPLPEAALASRHLGLATPDSVAELRGKIRSIANRVAERLDLPALLALAESAPDLTAPLPRFAKTGEAAARIAVARDPAFCFYYRENLDLLRSFGAELVFFSPLADEALPERIGGLYLGGGYPELHAERLAANTAMRRSVRDAVSAGLPTLAECGGFLYLHAGLADAAGRVHDMVGLLDGVGRNAGRLRRFGYIRLRALRDTLLCDKGQELPAHEFHYWDCDNPGTSFAAERAANGEAWNCIVANDTLFAGFPHLYFWSNPELARRFVVAAGRRAHR